MTKNSLSAVFISITILIVANLIRRMINKSKTNKKVETNNQKNELENGMLTLLASSEKENIEFFLKVFKHFKNVKLEENFIVFADKAVCVDFSEKTIHLEKALKKIPLALELEKTEIIFLCYSFDSKERILLENLKKIKVKIVEKNEIYNNLFLLSKIFPEKIFETKSLGKLKFKQIVKMSFRKNKAKNYFLSGLLVFFCSLIVKNNIFYVLMSSIMFCFAIYSLTKKEEVANFFD